ncbi:MAG: hypothetical protein AAGA87_12195 [Pseudomonadota bacterium]
MTAEVETECALTSPARLVIRTAACGFFLTAAFGMIPFGFGPVTSIIVGLLALPLLSVRWHHLAAVALMAIVILTASNAPIGFGPLGGLEHLVAGMSILFIVIASHLTAPGAMRGPRVLRQA